INEVGETTLKALLLAVAKKSPPEHSQAIQHAREFLDGAISIRTEHVKVAEEKIAEVRGQISELREKKTFEEVSQKSLELRALVHFNLRLNRALLDKFVSLRSDFEVRLKQLEQKPSLGRAAPAA